MQSKIESTKNSAEAFSRAFRHVLKKQHKNIQEILYLQKLFHNKDNVFGDEWFTKLVLEKKFDIDTYNQNKTFDINKI